MTARAPIWVVLTAALLLPTEVSAQAREPANFTLDRHVPGMDRESVIGTEVAELPLHGAYDAVLWLGFSHNLLLLARDSDNGTDRVGALVGPRLTAHALGAISLYDWVQVGVSVPVVLYQGRGSAPAANNARLGDLSAVGLGELRVSPKVRVLRTETAGVDVAVLPVVTFPTGAPSQAYLGERSLTVTPTVAISRRLGALRMAGNLAYHWRRTQDFLDIEIGPEIRAEAGAALDIEPLVALPMEIAASVETATAASSPFSNLNTTPFELFAQGGYRVTPELVAFAGAAVGLVAGFGTPDYRIFGGARWAPRPDDRDGDRVSDLDDGCPDTPEDADGFEDRDGCPDNDNDSDGIDDAQDQCPDDPENFDEVEDEDGCPEDSTVRVGDEKLEISETVYFETGKAIIQQRSYPLLEKIAEIIAARPGLGKIRIEGHTDSRGGEEDNRYLSQDRADAVRRQLIRLGVPKERLEAKGFGETRPIATNDTAKGRAKNRRVEFFIVTEGEKLRDRLPEE